ncbi:O-antigen/teichoic acid export membrane protein [Paraburkholderia sp. GAS333]|uniref:lipopolysaccharide biosynthesis protein n=1 Tax=Paraburkholderia sp. GAS333 TaxID=3156279 RepID=UPI003D1FFFC2
MKPLNVLLFSSLTGVLLEKIVAAVAAVASNHLFAKIYGAGPFGELQFALSLSAVAGSAALLFSAQSVAPILGKYPRMRHIVFYRAFRLRLLSTLCIMLAFCVGVWFLMSRSSAELAIVASVLLIIEPISLGSLMAYAEKSPWIVTRARTLASVVRVAWLFMAAHASAGPLFASIAWPIEAIVSAGGPFLRYSKLATSKPKSLNGDEMVTKTLLVRGLKFWPAVAAGMLVVKLDRVLLGMLLSKADLGVYSAAASLVEQWNAVGSALSLALGPGMVFIARNDVQLREKALKLGIYLGALGAVAFMGSLVIGHWVFLAIYGPAFEAGAAVMIYATGCSIVLFVDYGLTTWLIAARQYRLILIKQGVTLLAIAVSPLIMPKAWIMYGPSTATAVSLIVFWAVIYGRNAHQSSKLEKPSPSSSLADPNL